MERAKKKVAITKNKLLRLVALQRMLFYIFVLVVIIYIDKPLRSRRFVISQELCSF